MAHYVPETDEYHPIQTDQAQWVERLHKELPHHEAMIIIAEYPQRHERFEGLGAHGRRTAALRWIAQVTGQSNLCHRIQAVSGAF